MIGLTPFDDDGALDLGSIDSMVEFYEGAGVTGLKSAALRQPGPKLSPLDVADVERLLTWQAIRLLEIGAYPGALWLCSDDLAGSEWWS